MDGSLYSSEVGNGPQRTLGSDGEELLASMSKGALGPAGGTAASLAGALGVSLLLMVTTLPPKRAVLHPIETSCRLPPPDFRWPGIDWRISPSGTRRLTPK